MRVPAASLPARGGEFFDELTNALEELKKKKSGVLAKKSAMSSSVMGFIGLMEVGVMPVFLIKVIREHQFRHQTPKWQAPSSIRIETHRSKQRLAIQC